MTGAGAAVEWTAIDSVFVEVGTPVGAPLSARPRSAASGDGLRVAERLRERLQRELGFEVSCGIAAIAGRGADRLAHLASARRALCPARLRGAAARPARRRPAARSARRRAAAAGHGADHDARRPRRRSRTSAPRRCSARAARRSCAGRAVKTTARRSVAAAALDRARGHAHPSGRAGGGARRGRAPSRRRPRDAAAIDGLVRPHGDAARVRPGLCRVGGSPRRSARIAAGGAVAAGPRGRSRIGWCAASRCAKPPRSTRICAPPRRRC